jgi:hypothetical protein
MPWQVRIQRMPEFKRAKSIAFIGYALAATGTLLFTQIERIQNLRLEAHLAAFLLAQVWLPSLADLQQPS